MKHHFSHRSVLLLLLFATANLWAQIPTGYYDNASGKDGDELKTALHNIIKNHTVVSYGRLLEAFAYTDCKPNGTIWDIYSNIEYSLSGNCGTYDEEGDCWNREHTWPQSWFNEKSTPRSDLFHVYPTDGFVNGKRSNYPYGEVDNPKYTSGNGSKLGPCVTSGYSGTAFEPIDEYKGDIARSYFYMSVRYVGEDSGWGTSAMTNKSEIKDWAMTMLLRWSDQDPVSQKEIDRNNAVYGYQGNRNPFIDHPEYARMIWDPNYTPTSSYAITCATGLSHGSVSAPESASQGSAVSITATPEAGYMVDTYTVYKTGSPATTVAVSSNGTFVMPDYAVTVSASFKVNSTMYDIALGTVSHGGISASPMSAKSGTTINLTATPNSGYSLYSWYVFKTGDMNTAVAVSENSFTMPAYNVTVMATFIQGSGGSGNYEKVTTAPTDWSGEYLIVYETGNLAFDGGLETLDATGNTIAVTISDNIIAANATTNAAKFTIAPMRSGYSIQAANGKYIGNNSNSNNLTSSETPLANTLTFNGGNIDIVSSGGAYLRYNATSGQERFRYFKSGTYTNQQPIQLYKKTGTATPTHSIQFNNNGGSGTMNSQTVNENEPTALNPNDFTRENFVFDGWNTEADGSGTYYADEATVRLLADLTLYAQWEPLYSITISTGIAHGSVSANVEQALAEQTVTLTPTPESGYELGYWVVTDENDHAVTVTENQFEMPASDVTVSAVFNYVGVFEQQYYLVTDADQLVAGRTYLIVNKAAGKALGTQNNNNRAAVDVTVENDVIESIDGTVCALTLGKTGNNWTFFDANWGSNGGYLYAASSSSNNLKTQANNDTNGQWSISFDNDGMASVVAQGSNTRNNLRYNPNGSNDPLFSCYASTSNMAKVQLFIRSEQYEHNENTTLACLNTFDKHTVHSGVMLSADKVLGKSQLSDPNYLVLEDGAQFFHNVAGVKATVKKSISPYSSESGTNNGWHLIGYSFAGNGAVAEMTNLTANDYDLYYYDESTHYWMNQEFAANNFSELEPAKGYLYANSQPVTLGLKGTLEAGNATVNLPLSYTDGIDLAGFNLVGNPFAHNVTTFTGDNVADEYYRMNEAKDELIVSTISATEPLLPGEGFFVKATDDEASLSFNGQTRSEKATSGRIALELRENGLLIDRFIVKNDGAPLEKLTLKENGTKIFATEDAQDYAVIVIASEAKQSSPTEQPLNFKAAKNGTFTLNVNMDNMDLDYLHLIDNLTGTDIDLLTTLTPEAVIAGEDPQSQAPMYTFQAKTTDYASRFRLVFSAIANADGDNAPFAYVSNGNIIITADAHGASLQVIDMMGRVLVCRDASKASAISTTGMPAGVFVLRLIDGNNVRTQKIVVP